MLTKRFGFPDG